MTQLVPLSRFFGHPSIEGFPQNDKKDIRYLHVILSIAKDLVYKPNADNKYEIATAFFEWPRNDRTQRGEF